MKHQSYSQSLLELQRLEYWGQDNLTGWNFKKTPNLRFTSVNQHTTNCFLSYFILVELLLQ